MAATAGTNDGRRGPEPFGAPDRDPSAKGEQTRRAILRAAIERFGQDGFRSTSVAKIARDAGVGGTVTYNYFPNKEALFLAALDEDAAGVIEEGTACVFDSSDPNEWRQTLIVTLVAAVDRHPLARRVLSGLEPHVTGRVLDMPALTELRKAVAERLRTEQVAGTVRPDIDPVVVGSGVVVIVISLLTSILQFGPEGIDIYGSDVVAVFSAALDAVPPLPG
jgi:AcrR family transcriptional regulator